MNNQNNPTPPNGTQLYLNGHRFRSIYAASIDSGLNFYWLATKLKATGGKSIKIKSISVVSEIWIISHPDYLLSILA